jgi:Putative beta-barrel porin-2, OmpL-like. bbp2
MSNLSKCASRLTTGIFALAFALSLAPPGSAQSEVQAPGDSSAAASSAAPASSTQQQIDDLQKQMAAMEQQIAALKAQANAAPSVQAASYSMQTSPAPAAQAPAAAAPAAAPDKVTLAGLLGPTTLSGSVDAYYGYNYNHPLENISGLQLFDASTNAFGLNLAEFVLDKAPDATSADSRFGYHTAIGYGDAAKVLNCSDINNIQTGIVTDSEGAFNCSDFYVKEAYGSYLAPIGKGLTITVGKFVTPIGNEVIESSGNWNYSRSVLFYYAIPYFHFGASAKYAWNPKISATFYLVNGWNNSAIDHDEFFGQSSGLTYGTSIAYTPNAKWAVTENYFAGPVQSDNVCDFDVETRNCTSLNDWKQLNDTTIAYTPNAKWAFAINGDYGFGPHNWDCTSGTSCHTVGNQATWWGTAAYAKYTLNAKSYFAARYEYFEDPQGYAGLGANHAQEATGTYSYNLTSGLQVRGEYRYDFASSPIFQTGSDPDGKVKEQNTATLGFIYSFSSANAK